MERIIITFEKGGTFRGASVTDFDGMPKALHESGLADIFPAINEAALARVATLETEHVEVTGEKDSLTSQVESLTGERASLTEQVESLTADRNTVTTERDELTGQVATLTGEKDAIQSQLDTALARIVELETVPDEPTIEGVSKLTIMRRLGDKWPVLKAALSSLPEIVQDSWLLAQEIRADDPLFVEYRPQLMALLDMDDEEFNALLTPNEENI